MRAANRSKPESQWLPNPGYYVTCHVTSHVTSNVTCHATSLVTSYQPEPEQGLRKIGTPTR